MKHLEKQKPAEPIVGDHSHQIVHGGNQRPGGHGRVHPDSLEKHGNQRSHGAGDKHGQQKRRAGKTHNNWFTLYDAAMLSFTSYTKAGLRLATIVGFIMSAISLVVAFVYLILKLLYWDRFVAGMTPILLAVCILGSVQLFFIGFLGEYVLSINKRMMKRPLVIEEERINFDKDKTGNK